MAGGSVGGLWAVLALVVVMAFSAALMGAAAAASQTATTLAERALERGLTESSAGAGQGHPKPEADAATTVRDQAVTIPVANNDTDPDPTRLQVVGQPPKDGTATAHPDPDPGKATIVYAPNPGFTGTNSFQYDYCGGPNINAAGRAACPAATVTVTVIKPDPKPEADAATTVRDQAVLIDVMGNDRDPDVASLRVSKPPRRPGAKAEKQPDGHIRYIPEPGFTGTDTFQYDYCGEVIGVAKRAACPAATVTVTVIKPPGISSVEPGSSPPNKEVVVKGTTGSCNQTGKLSLEGTAVSLSVTGEFTARFTVPPGTFPGTYQLQLSVDCNQQTQLARHEFKVTSTTTTTGPPTSTTTTTTGPPTSTTTTTSGPPTTSGPTSTSGPTTTIAPTKLARLELRPARASIVAGARQAYDVEGFADDGTSLGNLTTATSFSIGPDGACDGASCSATTAGNHIVTGTVTKDGRRIIGLAELQVLQRQPTISSVQPEFTFAGMSVEVGGNTGSCSRAGILTFHGNTGDASMKVTADRQGNFVARVTIPKGTFPNVYQLELTVDCNGQLQRAQGDLSVLNIAPTAANDSARTIQDTPVSIPVTDNDRNPDPDTGYPTLVLESSPPTHGTTDVLADNRIRYTPDKGFVGQDRFQYALCDDIINAAGQADCGTATVTVTVTDAQACLPPPGNISSIKVNPSKSPGGRTLGITATVDRKLAGCPFRLFLGGTALPPDVPAGPDGSITAKRGVPKDAKPGPSPIRLATMSAQTVAQTPFEVVPPGLSLPLKLLISAGALLAGALARIAFRRWRTSQEQRRQRRLSQLDDLRAEPHTRPVEVSVEPEHDSTRTFTVRLEPHPDPGNQTVQEMNP